MRLIKCEPLDMILAKFLVGDDDNVIYNGLYYDYIRAVCL